MPRNVQHTVSFIFQGKDELSTPANNAKTAIEGLAKALNSATGRAAHFVNKGGGNIQTAFAQLNALGASLAANLKPVADAVSVATRSIENVNGSARRGARGLHDLAGAYNAMIVAKHVAGAIGAGVKPAMEMEQATMELGVATGLTEGNVQKLRKAAMEAASKTMFTPAEAMEAAKGLNLVVRDTDSTMKALLPTLEIAQTYLGKDVAKATKLAAKMMGSFGMSADQLEPSLNKLIAGSRAIGVPVDQLIGGMGKLGVAATLVKSNFEDIAPAYMIAVKAGLTAEEAGTGLKTAMGRLSDPKAMGKLKASLGISADIGGGFLTVRDLMVKLASKAEELQDNWPKMAGALRDAFGDRAVKPMAANINLMNKGIVDQNGNILRGAAAYDYMQSSMENSDNMLQKMNEVSMSTMTAKLELLKEAVSLLAVQVFTPVISILSKVVTAAQQAVVYLQKAFTLPVIGQVLEVIATAVRGLGGAIGAMIAVVLGVTAVSRIWAVALNFIGTNAGFAARMLTRLTGLTLAQAAAAEKAAVASDRMAAATKRGFFSFKLARVGLGGLLTMLMLLYEYWGQFADFWGKVFTGNFSQIGKGPKPAKKEDAQQFKQAWLAGQAMAQGAIEARGVMGLLYASTESLYDAVKAAEAVEKAKQPMASADVLAKTPAMMDKYLNLIDADKAGRAQFHEDMKPFTLAYEKMLRGEGPTNAEMIAAKESLSQFALALKGQPQLAGGKFAKNFDQTIKAFEAAATGAGGAREIAAAQRRYGNRRFIEQEAKHTADRLAYHQQRVARSSQNEMLARKAGAAILGVSLEDLQKQAMTPGMQRPPDIYSLLASAARQGKYVAPAAEAEYLAAEDAKRKAARALEPSSILAAVTGGEFGPNYMVDAKAKLTAAEMRVEVAKKVMDATAIKLNQEQIAALNKAVQLGTIGRKRYVASSTISEKIAARREAELGPHMAEIQARQEASKTSAWNFLSNIFPSAPKETAALIDEGTTTLAKIIEGVKTVTPRTFADDTKGSGVVLTAMKDNADKLLQTATVLGKLPQTKVEVNVQESPLYDVDVKSQGGVSFSKNQNPAPQNLADNFTPRSGKPLQSR